MESPKSPFDVFSKLSFKELKTVEIQKDADFTPKELFIFSLETFFQLQETSKKCLLLYTTFQIYLTLPNRAKFEDEIHNILNDFLDEFEKCQDPFSLDNGRLEGNSTVAEDATFGSQIELVKQPKATGSKDELKDQGNTFIGLGTRQECFNYLIRIISTYFDNFKNPRVSIADKVFKIALMFHLEVVNINRKFKLPFLLELEQEVDNIIGYYGMNADKLPLIFDVGFLLLKLPDFLIPQDLAKLSVNGTGEPIEEQDEKSGMKDGGNYNELLLYGHKNLMTWLFTKLPQNFIDFNGFDESNPLDKFIERLLTCITSSPSQACGISYYKTLFNFIHKFADNAKHHILMKMLNNEVTMVQQCGVEILKKLLLSKSIEFTMYGFLSDFNGRFYQKCRVFNDEIFFEKIDLMMQVLNLQYLMKIDCRELANAIEIRSRDLSKSICEINENECKLDLLRNMLDFVK
jgi:hypothetical protein